MERQLNMLVACFIGMTIILEIQLILWCMVGEDSVISGPIHF